MAKLRRNRHLAILLALISPFQGSRVAAEPVSLKVVVQGDGHGCLSERALKRRIAYYFTNADAQHGGFDVHVRVQADGHTAFEIERAGNSVAERAFPTLPEACAERVDAIAIAIAIALELVDTPAGAPAERAPEPVQDASSQALPETPPSDGAAPVRVEAPPAEASRDTPPPPAASKPGERAAERYSVRAGAGVLFGLLPSPVFAASAGGDIAIFDGSLYVSLSALLSGKTRNDLATGQVEAQIVAGRGALCYRVPLAWVALSVCPGIAIGGYVALGDHYDENRPANLPWMAALGHAGLRMFDGAFKLELSFEGYLNLIRPSLWVEGASDDSLTTPVVAMSSLAELVVVF